MFDKGLAALAAKVGSDIRVGTFVDGLIVDGGKVEGVRARGFEGRSEVFADIVIAADGVMSRVSRWAGLNTTLKLEDIETCAQFQMVGIDLESPSLLELHVGNKIPPAGYGWGPRSRAERPIDYLRSFVNSRPNLRKGRIIEINVGGVPVSGPTKETVKDGLLVVGDAARHVSPITGGGIGYAMRGGDIAGEVAAKAVAEGDVSKKRLIEYEKRWREAFGERLDRYYQVKKVTVEFSDEELDSIAKWVQGIGFDKISLTDLLKAL